MSTLSKEQIAHIAELAKLQINEHESEQLSTKLSAVLNLINQMQDFDTHRVEPMSHTVFQNQKLREDIAITLSQRDEIQKLSDSVENGFYLVPKVLE